MKTKISMGFEVVKCKEGIIRFLPVTNEMSWK